MEIRLIFSQLTNAGLGVGRSRRGLFGYLWLSHSGLLDVPQLLLDTEIELEVMRSAVDTQACT
jgi:hypothetical protein